MMVQMHVLARKNQVVMVMLDGHEVVKKIAPMMVIDQHNATGHQFVILPFVLE